MPLSYVLRSLGSRYAHLVNIQWEKYTEIKTIGLLYEAATTFQTIRRHLKRLGELSNTPVEPESQTRVLEASQDVPGVVFAGVPGGTFQF